MSWDSPRRAGAAELVRRAGGRAELVRTVTAVVLVVAHPVGGDAAAPAASKFRFQTGRRWWGASHALTTPHTVLTGTRHTHTQGVNSFCVTFLLISKRGGILAS